MTLYVVRHASAGKRSRFVGEDLDRPLDDVGAAQAEALAAALGAAPIGAVLSSAALRCRQTVEPLAARLGLGVQIEPSLTEGADPAIALEILRSAPGTVVACSHGDIIPELIRLLTRREGMPLEGKRGGAKGSVWRLDRRGRDFVGARYHADPAELAAVADRHPRSA